MSQSCIGKSLIKIVVFGDSISFGQYVPPHSTWVGKLSLYLGSIFSYEEILLQCEAVNGRTTRMALEAMPQEVQKYEPTIVVVQFGLNDCNHWVTDKGLPRVSEEAFVANLNEMVMRCKQFGVEKIIINTNHPTGRPNPITEFSKVTYNESNMRYSKLIRDCVEILNDEDVVLVDIEKHFLNILNKQGHVIDDYLLPAPDALHLNIKGHEIYFDVLSELLLKTIKEMRG